MLSRNELQPPDGDVLVVHVADRSTDKAAIECDTVMVTNNKTAKDPNDRGPTNSSDCKTGMPIWGVSEPYLTLWVLDEPLGYQPALGPRVSLEVAYNQMHDTHATFDRAIFGTGLQWNCSWLSYIATNGVSGNYVVNLTGGGTLTYTNTTDLLTNTRLTGDTTNGFTRSYSDGSKDVYTNGLVRTVTSERGLTMTNSWDNLQRLTGVIYPDGTTVSNIYYRLDGNSFPTSPS